MAKRKKLDQRVQLQVAKDEVADWEAEATTLRITLSEFIRRSCRRTSEFLKRRRMSIENDAALKDQQPKKPTKPKP